MPSVGWYVLKGVIKCYFEKEKITKTVKIWALVMIDEGSGWPEIIAIQNKYAEEIAKIVDDQWLNRYPHPSYCIHDNGGRLIGKRFKEMLKSYGVLPKLTTVRNPQSDGVHERMHLVLCEILCS